MSRLYKIGIFLAITIASFSIASVLIISRGEELFSEDSKLVETINEEYSLDFENVTDINLEVVSGVIRFYPTTESEGKVTIEGRSFAMGWKKPHKFEVSNVGETIEISESTKWGGIGFSFNDIEIKVYVPEHYDGNLVIKSVSSDVKLNTFSFDDVTIETVSGDVSLNNMTIPKLVIKTVSGEIDVTDLKSEDINIKTVSGDIEFELDSEVFDINIDTISGDTDIDVLNDVSFNYDFTVVSANISIKLDQLDIDSNKDIKGVVGTSNNIVEITSVSGDIDIR